LRVRIRLNHQRGETKQAKAARKQPQSFTTSHALPFGFMDAISSHIKLWLTCCMLHRHAEIARRAQIKNPTSQLGVNLAE